jgi:16S rRNA (guanine527-N7)-methyltransferase
MSDATPARHDFAPALGADTLDAALQAKSAALERFRALLETANRQLNLVGRSTLADFHRRHVVDCAQLLCFAPAARRWADLGSGAGLPGLVLAILLKDTPGAKVHLVESVAKKCRFLSAVATDLDVPVEVHCARAESLRIDADVVTARACAPMSRLLELAEPTMRLGARGLFLKGANLEEELAEARWTWRFRSRSWPSLSDSRGRIVAVEGLGRVR